MLSCFYLFLIPCSQYTFFIGLFYIEMQEPSYMCVFISAEKGQRGIVIWNFSLKYFAVCLQ